MYDMIVVGGGPAGLTAAIYGLRAGKTVLVIEKAGFGGQIAFSPKVENIPGTRCIRGTEFADRLTEQVMALGADVELENVTQVIPGTPFVVQTEEGGTYRGQTVILATGVRHRTLGLPGEEALIGNGISFCAVCDGAFYTDRDVVMVGGGNSAMQEALLLSEVCRTVTIVQNLPDFTGEQRLAQALRERENVRTLFSTLAVGYRCENGTLVGLDVRAQDGTEQTLCADGVFLAVGLQPENDAFAPLVELDAQGYFDASESCLTKTAGLFVAGDCRRKQIRQVTTAASDGAIAAMAACRYLQNLSEARE